MPTWLAKLKKYGSAGLANVIVTLLPAGGDALQAGAGPQRVQVGRRAPVFIRLKVKATSAARERLAVVPLHVRRGS